jgi:hypothetical protein
MKKMLASLLFMPVIAFSQSNESEEIDIPTHCVSIQVLEDVTADFNELPMLRGKTERQIDGQLIENTLVIFVNMETKSWTIAEKMVNGRYCVLAAGNSFQPVPKEIIDRVIKEREQKRS